MHLLQFLAQRPHTGRRSTEAHVLLVLMSAWPMLAGAAAAILCLSGSQNFSTLLTCQCLRRYLLRCCRQKHGCQGQRGRMPPVCVVWHRSRMAQKQHGLLDLCSIQSALHRNP